MKKIKKIAYLFVLLLLVVTAFVGCTNPNAVSKEEREGKGVHTAKVQETQGYFVRNGLSDYKLVLPVDAKDYEKEAATLINKYTKFATDMEYDVITDAQVYDGGKYISLGETTLLHESGISIPFAEFGNSGFRMISKDNVLFLAGARSNLRKGTYYAAQEFLKYTIDFKVYSIEEIQYEKTSVITAKSFDVVEIPEFDHRMYTAVRMQGVDGINLMRNDVNTDGLVPLLKDGQNTSHSHFVVLPPEKYFADHPDWYWYKFEGNTECTDWADMFLYGQLCLSNQEMIDEFVRQSVQLYRANPDAELIHLGMQDSQTLCQCSNCDQMRKDYNTNGAGLNVIFTNQVAKRVTEEIHKTEPQRKLYFQTFAYLTIIDPPANYDEKTGKWTPHCDEVIPLENVYMQYAPLTCNTTETLDDKVNQSFYHALEGWTYLCSLKNAKLSCWDYGAYNFNWMMINHKSWDTAVKQLRIYSEHGISRIYRETAGNPQGCAFVFLRSYVESMLMWNLTLNYQDLVEDFIVNYYGPAAPYVQRAFDQMTVHYEKLTEEGFSGIHNLDIGVNAEGRWTFNYVESQRLLFEKAFEAIEPLKEQNRTEYEKYYKRLAGEYMENMYMQLEFYMEKYDSEYVANTINRFEEATQLFDMVHFGYYSGRTVSEYLVKWRGSNV